MSSFFIDQRCTPCTPSASAAESHLNMQRRKLTATTVHTPFIPAECNTVYTYYVLVKGVHCVHLKR